MQLGIGSYTYPWAIGVPGHLPPEPLRPLALLERARDLGVRVVQFCDNLPLVSLPDRQLGELAFAAQAMDLAIEVGTRGIEERELLAYLGLARRLECSFVRLVVDRPGDEPTPEEVVRRLKPILVDYHAAGVKLALENHDRFSSNTLAWIVEELGHEQVGICLDTVNSFGALEGPEVTVRTLAPYALNLHVKDFMIQRVPSKMGFTLTGCPAGLGRLDIPWLLEQLRSVGRDVNAILELWTPPGATLAETLALEQGWAIESVRYLRQLIPG